MMDEKRIAELRALRGSGLISAVGEYTPDELWEALDTISDRSDYAQGRDDMRNEMLDALDRSGKEQK